MLRRTFSALLICAALSAASHAATPTVEIRNARAAATPPDSTVAAVYFEAAAAHADTLLSASTTAAAKAEIHATLEENGVMKMRRLDSVEVTPEKPLKLEPGGLHLMLFGLEEPLRMHARFALTLHFERAGAVIVEVHVVAPGGAHSHH